MIEETAIVPIPYNYSPSPTWDDEFKSFCDLFPVEVARICRQYESTLIEVVLDLGRPLQIRTTTNVITVNNSSVNQLDLDQVTEKLGNFNSDNRAALQATLHRISALRNREDEIIGLTCRLGRTIYGATEPLRDLLNTKESIIFVGPPGVGKTTLLREAARIMADNHNRRVMIIDTSNEIGGDGNIPHVGIGSARRLQVRSPEEQAKIMIQAVENHNPQVIVIDEIGTLAEAEAARTIAERGVQLFATAHGKSLSNILVNPLLNPLLGGVQPVILSDEIAVAKGTSKTVLERMYPPSFTTLIEVRGYHSFVIHRPLDAVVDSYLGGRPIAPEKRTYNPVTGRVDRIIEHPEERDIPFGNCSYLPDFHELPQKRDRRRRG